MARVVLECTHEAIFDAGLNLEDFRGKRAAICVGAATFESEDVFYSNQDLRNTYCIVE